MRHHRCRRPSACATAPGTAQGGHEGHVPDLELQLREYYEIRGWDENGVPTKQKLEELGLLDIVGEL